MSVRLRFQRPPAREVPDIGVGDVGAQTRMPLVIRTANGGGLRFGAQHSQAVENWAMTIPGLKVVAPSDPVDLIGLFATAVRSDDPVMFFEQEHPLLHASIDALRA